MRLGLEHGGGQAQEAAPETTGVLRPLSHRLDLPPLLGQLPGTPIELFRAFLLVTGCRATNKKAQGSSPWASFVFSLLVGAPRFERGTS